MTAAIVYDNLADAGTVTASSWIAAAPPTMLQNAHTTRRWQGRNGSTEYILLVFGAQQEIDTIGLFKCAKLVSGTQSPMTAAATCRVRVSSVDITGVAGDVYDSSAQSIDEAYAALIALLPAVRAAIAVRIDLTETGAEALQAGRLVVGLRNSFDWNFTYGWSFGFSDLSRLKRSAGGQTFVDRDDRFRIMSVQFEMLNAVERYSFVQETDRLNGISQDVLFITDPASTNLGRDTVWGLMQDMNPPTQPYFELFNKQYQVQERL
jgi:hypothetical protein